MTILCGQCGGSYAEDIACGPTHAAIGAGVSSLRNLLNYPALPALRQVDPDDLAIVEAAKLTAAGRKVSFVVTLKDGLVIDVEALDAGAREGPE